MSDLIFAFVHIGLLLAVIGYAVISLVRGHPGRFLLILGLLAVYYFLVLHKAVVKEIRRKQDLRRTR